MFSYSASLNLPTRFFSPSDCAESSWLVAEVSSAAAELLCTTLEICSIPCSICFNIFACSVELSLAPFTAFAKSFMDSRILFNAATVFFCNLVSVFNFLQRFFNQIASIDCRLCTVTRQFSDLICHNRKTFSGFPGTCCLNGSIQGQQVGLTCNLLDGTDDVFGFPVRYC